VTHPSQQLAELHAPKTSAEIERAAREMVANGYSDHTIAAILRIDVSAIRQMLGPCPSKS